MRLNLAFLFTIPPKYFLKLIIQALQTKEEVYKGTTVPSASLCKRRTLQIHNITPLAHVLYRV